MAATRTLSPEDGGRFLHSFSFLLPSRTKRSSVPQSILQAPSSDKQGSHKKTYSLTRDTQATSQETLSFLRDQPRLKLPQLPPQAPSPNTPTSPTTPTSSNLQLNSPDSGFYGAITTSPCTSLKTPESDISSSAITPSSVGSGQRKRKTVTIDESQTSIVVISPDDLFRAYWRHRGQSPYEDEADPPWTEALDTGQSDDLLTPDDSHVRQVVDPYTGWPLRRSESLESRDNPFLPGGELSREAEDLLARATIIRDHFYLKEDGQYSPPSSPQLQQEQPEQLQYQQREPLSTTPGQDHALDPPEDNSKLQLSSSSIPQIVEERISPPSRELELASAAVPSVSFSPNGGGNGDVSQPRSRENNGKLKDSKQAPAKPSIPDSEPHGQVRGEASKGDKQPAGQARDPDKKIKNKCCSIM